MEGRQEAVVKKVIKEEGNNGRYVIFKLGRPFTLHRSISHVKLPKSANIFKNEGNDDFTPRGFIVLQSEWHESKSIFQQRERNMVCKEMNLTNVEVLENGKLNLTFVDERLKNDLSDYRFYFQQNHQIMEVSFYSKTILHYLFHHLKKVIRRIIFLLIKYFLTSQGTPMTLVGESAYDSGEETLIGMSSGPYFAEEKVHIFHSLDWIKANL